MTPPGTIAACDACGRGYIYINHEGVRCLANDGGRCWLLSVPEYDANDDAADRLRWKEDVARRYLREPSSVEPVDIADTERPGPRW